RATVGAWQCWRAPPDHCTTGSSTRPNVGCIACGPTLEGSDPATGGWGPYNGSSALSHDGRHHVAAVIIIVIVVLIALVFVVMYNGLVRLRNRIDSAWSQIEVHLERRHDLIPNLIETVKGYAAHERQTLEGGVQARDAA